MKRLVTTVLSLTLLCAVASSALAETTKLNGAKVSLWFPDDWSMEKDGTMLAISDPAEEVGLAFVTIPADALEEAADAIDEQIATFATDVTTQGEPETTEINGMQAVLVDAKGKAEGKKVDISVAVIMRPGKKALLVFGIVESAKLKRHEKTLVKIVKSLKPLK